MSTVAAQPSIDRFRDELRVLVPLAVPISLAQTGLISINLVDAAIIGHVAVDDLAAVSIGRSIYYMVISLSFGISLALDPLATQAIGAGQLGRAWSALGATLRAGMLVSTLSAAAALGLTLLLAPLGVEPALVIKVRNYLLGQLPAFFFYTAFMAGKTFLYAHGDTRPALRAAIVANAINLVTCNLLVRGDEFLRWAHLPAVGLPRLGTTGAGLAASISSGVLAAIVLAATLRHRPGADQAASEAVPVATVYHLGVPIGLQLLAELGVFSLVGMCAGRLGAPATAAHQIVMGLTSFSFMWAFGVGGATAVRVGNAVGEGASPRRRGLVGIVLGAAGMSLSAVVFIVAPRLLVGAFTTDQEVIGMGVDVLTIAACFQLFDGVQSVAAGALRGAGDVKFPLLANFLAHWLFGFPLALGLCFGLGLGIRGLWVGLTAGLITIATLLTARFLYISRGKITRV